MKIVATLICLLISLVSLSQSTQTSSQTDTSKVYRVVGQMPYYPGGEEAMIAFINKSIKYPRLEKRKKIEGKVVALIIINQDGSVSDIRVKKQVSPNIDKEAIRVISLLKFNPGIEAGKPVRVQFAIPIYFKL